MAYTLQDSYASGDDTQDNSRGANWNCQTFTAGASYTITQVSLLIGRTGSPGTDCWVAIYATSGGKPTGTALVTGNFSGNALAVTAAWTDITLGAGTALTSGTQYAIVMAAPSGSAGNLVFWRMDGSSPSYTGGSYGQSTDSGANWTMDTGYDFLFKTYSTAGGGGTVTTLADDNLLLRAD